MARTAEPPLVSPHKAVARMRRSPAYLALPSMSKALVEHLVTAVLVDGRFSGFVDRTEAELMVVLGTRSKRQVGEAVNAAIAAEVVVKGARAFSRGYGSDPRTVGPHLFFMILTIADPT